MEVRAEGQPNIGAHGSRVLRINVEGFIFLNDPAIVGAGVALRFAIDQLHEQTATLWEGQRHVSGVGAHCAAGTLHVVGEVIGSLSCVRDE